MSGHNIVNVASLQNLIVRLDQPESKVPPFIYVTTWPDPRDLNVETFVRVESLPPKLQAEIREHVSGVKISDEAASTGVPGGEPAGI